MMPGSVCSCGMQVGMQKRARWWQTTGPLQREVHEWGWVVSVVIGEGTDAELQSCRAAGADKPRSPSVPMRRKGEEERVFV